MYQKIALNKQNKLVVVQMINGDKVTIESDDAPTERILDCFGDLHGHFADVIGFSRIAYEIDDVPIFCRSVEWQNARTVKFAGVYDNIFLTADIELKSPFIKIFDDESEEVDSLDVLSQRANKHNTFVFQNGRMLPFLNENVRLTLERLELAVTSFLKAKQSQLSLTEAIEETVGGGL